MAEFASKSQEEEGRPSSKEVEFFDGVFLFDEADRDCALRDIRLLLNDEGTVLKNGRHPKILMRFDPVGECCEASCDFITWLEKALSCSTFVLVYCSKQFFSSNFKYQIQSHIMNHSFETDGAVYDKIGNQYNIIPIRPAKDEKIMKMPFTQIGFLMADFDSEEYRGDFRQRFVKTFNTRLYIREERERRESEKRRLKEVTSTEAVGQLADCFQGKEEPKTCAEEVASVDAQVGAMSPPIKSHSEESTPLSEVTNGVATKVVRTVSSPSYCFRKRKEKRLERIDDPSFKHLP